MLEQLLEYDTALFQYLNGLGSTTWDSTWRIITEKWSSIPLYITLLVLIYKNYGIKHTLITLVTIACIVACVDQLANLFKHGFQRPRPCQVAELKETIRYVAKRCGRYGYFSAHAGSSMAVAVFVGLLLKSKYYYLPFILLFWSVIIAYSRIYLGVHYPLDIFTGMTIGAFFGWIFKKIHSKAITKFGIVEKY